MKELGLAEVKWLAQDHKARQLGSSPGLFSLCCFKEVSGKEIQSSALRFLRWICWGNRAQLCFWRKGGEKKKRNGLNLSGGWIHVPTYSSAQHLECHLWTFHGCLEVGSHFLPNVPGPKDHGTDSEWAWYPHILAQELIILPLLPAQPRVPAPRHPDHTLPKYSSHSLPHRGRAPSTQMLRSTIWGVILIVFLLYPLCPIHQQVPLSLPQKHIRGRAI